MMDRPIKKTSRGFTLLELLVTIVIISIIALAVAVPIIAASAGLGSTSESRQAQLSALAQKEMETISAQLSGMSQEKWVETLSTLVSDSPISASSDVILDGRTYRSVRTFSCVKSDFASDPACSDGFAKVEVTVTEVDGSAKYTLMFIKTRTGL